MMFKAIPMHTKPLNHTKNIEILTNYIKKTQYLKISYKSQLLEMFLTTPKVIICAKDAPRCPGHFKKIEIY